MGGGWIGTVLTGVLATMAPAWAEDPEPQPPSVACVSSIAFQLLPVPFPRKLLDRNRKRINGRLEAKDNSVWLITDWNEPVWVADGDPFRLIPEIKAEGPDTLLFTHVQVY